MKAITLATIAFAVLLVNAAPPDHPPQGRPPAPQPPGKQPITPNKGKVPVNQDPQHNRQDCPNDIKIDPDEDQGSDGPPPGKTKQKETPGKNQSGKQDVVPDPKQGGQQKPKAGPAAGKGKQARELETSTARLSADEAGLQILTAVQIVGNVLFERSHFSSAIIPALDQGLSTSFSIHQREATNTMNPGLNDHLSEDPASPKAAHSNVRPTSSKSPPSSTTPDTSTAKHPRMPTGTGHVSAPANPQAPPYPAGNSSDLYGMCTMGMGTRRGILHATGIVDTGTGNLRHFVGIRTPPVKHFGTGVVGTSTGHAKIATRPVIHPLSAVGDAIQAMNALYASGAVHAMNARYRSSATDTMLSTQTSAALAVNTDATTPMIKVRSEAVEREEPASSPNRRRGSLSNIWGKVKDSMRGNKHGSKPHTEKPHKGIKDKFKDLANRFKGKDHKHDPKPEKNKPKGLKGKGQDFKNQFHGNKYSSSTSSGHESTQTAAHSTQKAIQSAPANPHRTPLAGKNASSHGAGNEGQVDEESAYGQAGHEGTSHEGAGHGRVHHEEFSHQRARSSIPCLQGRTYKPDSDMCCTHPEGRFSEFVQPETYLKRGYGYPVANKDQYTATVTTLVTLMRRTPGDSTKVKLSASNKAPRSALLNDRPSDELFCAPGMLKSWEQAVKHGGIPRREPDMAQSYSTGSSAIGGDAALEGRGFDPFAFIGTVADRVKGVVDGITRGPESKVTTMMATTMSEETVTESVTTIVVSMS